MKYIIKNCPNYLPEFFYLGACKCEKGDSINGNYIENCKEITDCPLKQIVEKCKYFKNKIMQDIAYKKGADMVVNEVLNLLEIEECE